MTRGRGHSEDSQMFSVCFPFEARLVILLILTVGSQSKLPKEQPSLRRAEDSVQGGNWSKKLTTYLLLIPGGSSGGFWNGKKEGVVANSNSFCCLPARWLYQEVYLLSSVSLSSWPPLLQACEGAQTVPAGFQSSTFCFQNLQSSLQGSLLLKRSQLKVTYQRGPPIQRTEAISKGALGPEPPVEEVWTTQDGQLPL